ncbi:MAG: hypothetical protein ACR2NX_13120 [Chthoniobacterales bacterium]
MSKPAAENADIPHPGFRRPKECATGDAGRVGAGESDHLAEIVYGLRSEPRSSELPYIEKRGGSPNDRILNQPSIAAIDIPAQETRMCATEVSAGWAGDRGR